MNNILIFSQDGNFTALARSIAIGKRNKNYLIGDKLQELLDEKKITLEDLIKEIGNNYRNIIIKISENEEIPSPKIIEMITRNLEVNNDYFEDKGDLYNVIITDGGVIVGTYSTNKKAKEVKKQLDREIRSNYLGGTPIVLDIPKE